MGYTGTAGGQGTVQVFDRPMHPRCCCCTGSYSLAARCGSEMLASGFVIWLGESVLANEILGKTKVRKHCVGFAVQCIPPGLAQ